MVSCPTWSKKPWTDSTAAATANNSDLTWSRLWTCSFGFRFFAAKLKRHRARIALRFIFNIRLMLCILLQWQSDNLLCTYTEEAFKGQVILKGVLNSSISSKKQTKEFDFTTVIHQINRLVFVRFLEEIEDTKKPFRNYLTFNILTYI